MFKLWCFRSECSSASSRLIVLKPQPQVYLVIILTIPLLLSFVVSSVSSLALPNRRVNSFDQLNTINLPVDHTLTPVITAK